MASLKTLPDITFAEKDASEIQSSVISTYEEITGRKLAAGDPIRLFLLSLAAIIVQQRVVIDYSAKMNLLAYAKGDYLDHIGVLVGCERIPAAAAATTLLYTLSAVRETETVIPKGSRVQAGDKVYFATKEELVILAGETTGTVEAACTTLGEAGNDYAIGELTQIVDPVAFVASCTNLSKSEGGAEEEEDEPYRSRIQEAPESFSDAGSEGAYRYWAKSASALIIDVAVLGPLDEGSNGTVQPGCVEVYPLLEGGELPGNEILEDVDKVLSKRTVRPLTDYLTIAAPQAIFYDVDMTYYIDNEDATNASTIREAVQKAVDNYVLWQKTRLGRDIDPTELYYRVRAAGARHVTIATPVFQKLEKAQVGIANAVGVMFGGLEDG